MLAREDKARLIALLIVAGFAFAVAYAYFRGFYLKDSYPKNSFLFYPSDAGNDFFHLFATVKGGSPYAYQWSLYLPFTYLPIILLTSLTPYVAYGSLFALFLAFVVHLVYSHLQFLPSYDRLLITFVLSFLSYPVIFMLDRGNFEVLIFAFLYLFLVSYRRGELKWAVLFLACAASMKAYPLLLGILFVKDRKYVHFAATLGIVVMLTCLSAALFPGGILQTFQIIALKVGAFRRDYVIGDAGVAYTSSYFAVLKLLLSKMGMLSAGTLMRILPFYLVGAFAFCGVIVLYILWCERTLWKIVALLCCLMILLPHVTGDYKLTHLLLPMMLFIATSERGRFDRLYAVLFGLILIPKAFIWLRYNGLMPPLPISNVLNPCLMTGLMMLIICDGLFSGRPGSAGEYPMEPAATA